MYTGGTGGGTGARGQYLLEEKENGFGGGQILKPRQTAGEKISSCTGTPPDSLASGSGLVKLTSACHEIYTNTKLLAEANTALANFRGGVEQQLLCAVAPPMQMVDHHRIEGPVVDMLVG